MKLSSRSALLIPAWSLILVGSGVFFYSAWLGHLGS